MIRRVFILFLFNVLSAGYPASAQQETGLIDENFSQTPLREVFSVFGQKYSLKISFREQDVLNITVTAVIKHQTPESALMQVLLETSLAYRVNKDRSFTVYRDDRKRIEDELTSADQGQISGVVLSRSGEDPVGSAAVSLKNTIWRTLTDSAGRFTISGIPFGEYRLFISLPDFLPDSIPIQALPPKTAPDTFFYSYRRKTDSGQEKEAAANPFDHFSAQPSAYRIGIMELTNHPAKGEPDVLNSIQSLQGISGKNDVFNEFHVRGGTPDQNLLMLDRATVYHPYHLFGLMSAFNSDIVGAVDVSTGGFSSAYGNRMSSVIDIRTRDAAEGHIHGSGELNLLSSKVMLHGQAGPKVYYLVSARRFYWDQFAKLVNGIKEVRRQTRELNETLPQYYFYDFYGKILVKPHENHRLGISSFTSKDYFFATITEKHYGGSETGGGDLLDDYYEENDRIQFGWDNHIFSSFWEYDNQRNWLSRLTVYWSQAPAEFSRTLLYNPSPAASPAMILQADSLNRLSYLDHIDVGNRIRDITVCADARFKPHDNHTVLFGGEWKHIQLKYRWDNIAEFDKGNPYLQLFFDNPADTFRYEKTADLIAFYLEDLWQIEKRFSVKPGFRFESFPGAKPSFTVSPRFSAMWTAMPGWTLKTSAGLYRQSLFTAREAGYFGFLDVSFYADRIPLQSSWHFILGTDYRLPWNMQIGMEGYYKTLDHLYRSVASTRNSPVFIKGSGKARGMEMSLKRKANRFNFDAVYQLSFVTRKFQGKDYYPNYDQRHQFRLGTWFVLPKGWVIETRWQLASGRAYQASNYYTVPVDFNPSTGDFGTGDDMDNLALGELQHLYTTSRMPVFHRLDLNITKTLRMKSWSLSFYMNAINLYFRNNPILYKTSEKKTPTGETDGSGEEQLYLKRKPVGIPILPSLGMRFQF